MPRARLLQFAPIALIALLVTACSTGASPDASLDGPATTITLATSGGGVGTLGVPFDEGAPVVTSVSVAITADVLPTPVELRFMLEDDVYRYDPDGDLTAVEFGFNQTATVTLPAGSDYTFATRGEDAGAIWMAYGETEASVDATTTGVALALQTLIDDANLENALTAIARGQTIDLLLGVTAPGGYAVPTADYTVAYTMDADDGSVVSGSKLGARIVAHESPVNDSLTVTATVTGWRNVGGDPVWVDAVDGVVAGFTIPFTVPTGFAFDAVAPDVSIDPIASVLIGSPVAVGGGVSDDVGIERVQVYVGPVLVASSVLGEADTAVLLGAGTWSTDLAPMDEGTHTVTVLAIDTAGNEQRASADVAVAPPRTLTFVLDELVTANVVAGETVYLSGPASSSFSPSNIELFVSSGGSVSTDLIQVVDGAWRLVWTVPAGEVYVLLNDYQSGTIQAYIQLEY